MASSETVAAAAEAPLVWSPAETMHHRNHLSRLALPKTRHRILPRSARGSAERQRAGERRRTCVTHRAATSGHPGAAPLTGHLCASKQVPALANEVAPRDAARDGRSRRAAWVTNTADGDAASAETRRQEETREEMRRIPSTPPAPDPSRRGLGSSQSRRGTPAVPSVSEPRRQAAVGMSIQTELQAAR